MRIGIVGAMDVEITYVLERLENVVQTEKSSFTFYEGNYLHHEIILVRSGIGKVMASMLATILLDAFEIDRLINIGVAGGIRGKAKANDCLLIDSAFYSDVDVTIDVDGTKGYPYGMLPGFPRKFVLEHFEMDMTKFDFDIIRGAVLTGDQFVTDGFKTEKLIEAHFKDDNICAMDMETTAFAQVCHVFEVPFMAIRAISDVVGSKEETDMYSFNLIQACSHSGMVVLEYLEQTNE